MKYIRTKDRVVELKKITINDKLTDDYIHEKVADTIEELCDGFIFKDTKANELHFVDKNSGMSILGASLFSETLRGFIETDKGLIYVAKMNESLEWELL